MVSSDTLIWFVFRLIDVAVIGVIGWYIFVKQLLPAIYKHREHEEHLKEQSELHLHTQRQDIIDQTDALAEEAAYLEKLKVTLTLWQQVSAEQNERMYAHIRHLQTLQQERMLQQQQALESKLAQDVVVPQAYGEAAVQIKQAFDGDQPAATYLHNALIKLQEQK